MGESVTLFDGTVMRFDGYREFAALQVSHDPAQLAGLVTAVLSLVGLLANLLLRPVALSRGGRPQPGEGARRRACRGRGA